MCLLKINTVLEQVRNSCQTQLVSLVEDLICAMDNQYQVDVILLDYTKVFDKVPHRCLLTKLLHYGIGGYIHNMANTANLMGCG